MQLTSLEFAFFFLAVLCLVWIARSRSDMHGRVLRLVLLGASYTFYASFGAGFAALLLTVSVLTWGAGRVLARQSSPLWRKATVGTYLAAVLGQLCFFKYYGLASELSGMLPELALALPVGVSFFSFQGIGCVVDAYRDPKAAPHGLLDVLVFMAFFPTLLSGPILRANTFIPQLSAPPVWTDSDRAFWLIAVGLFKKVALSSYLSEHVTRQLFSAPEAFSGVGALVGVLAYSAQIYLDFSGYSDLAQGLAGLMGLKVPDNFRQPYGARNLREFWKGWHISLSTWLRDYLYIPLGGNRTGHARRNLNLLITMGLGGFWHGASLNFLVWGLLHGFGLVALHAFDRGPETPTSAPALRQAWGRLPATLRDACAWAATFGFVTLAWVFFAAPDFAMAMDVLGRIGSLDASGTHPGVVATAITLGVIGMQALRLPLGAQCPAWLTRLPLPARAVALGALGALIVRMGPDGVLPFIYFSF